MKWGVYDLLLKLPKMTSTRKLKRVPCVFCHRKVRIGQRKFHYDSGYEVSKAKGQEEFWDMHIDCYNAVLKIAIVKLQQELKEVFN